MYKLKKKKTMKKWSTEEEMGLFEMKRPVCWSKGQDVPPTTISDTQALRELSNGKCPQKYKKK